MIIIRKNEADLYGIENENTTSNYKKRGSSFCMPRIARIKSINSILPCAESLLKECKLDQK
ncbi:hypothetical protein [Anaerophilus nitritogenes]|uniref:hypothetical protein n=1 Tax=Anaerophilus nitritogenes TaxID=2498136 RepID=UPI00101CDB41|nr:hypothetical protein [Anaerophilus nitritogenes]